MGMAPVVALDVGTFKVCALVGEIREDGNVMITGMGRCPSVSIRKGLIRDIDMVASCMGTAIKSAEESSAVDIRQVYLTISGGRIQSLVSPGTVPVQRPDHGITLDDLDDVREIAGAVDLPHDRERLHSISGKYTVDDQHDVINPVGMHGARLSLDMLIIHGSRNLLNNVLKAASSVGLGVLDVMLDAICSSLAVLTAEQKKSGVLLIDLGAGTSSYVVFADEVMAAAGVLEVGGDHITNDIALGFGISLKRAELLKCESGSAMLEPDAHYQQIPVRAEVGFSACSVGLSDLNTVINARVYELFALIRSELEKRLDIGQLGAGLVVTGGGAHLKGVAMAASEVFDMPCVVGKPRNFSGMASVYEGPEYASALGMIRHAARRSAESSRAGSFGGWVKRVLGVK